MKLHLLPLGLSSLVRMIFLIFRLKFVTVLFVVFLDSERKVWQGGGPDGYYCWLGAELVIRLERMIRMLKQKTKSLNL